MSIKIKQNGQWVNLHVLSGDTNIIDLNLLPSDWVEYIEDGVTKYKSSTPVNGLNSQFRAIAFLNYTGEDVFEKIVCEEDSITIHSSAVPENIIGTALYSINNLGSENRIYLVGGVTKEQLDEIIYQIEDKIGLSSSSDGDFTDFTKMRQLKKAVFKLEPWNNSEEGESGEKPISDNANLVNRIVIDYLLQGEAIDQNSTRKDYIYLDEQDYPVCGNTNGITWQIGWEGFEREETD